MTDERAPQSTLSRERLRENRRAVLCMRRSSLGAIFDPAREPLVRVLW